MGSPKTILLLLLAFFLVQASTAFAAKQSYIVYMGAHPHGPNPTDYDMELATDSHHSFLASFLGSHDMAKDAIIYSYNRHVNGFVAMLEEDQASHIAKHSKVVSVFLDKERKLHTTRSWDFMMLEKNGSVLPHSLWSKARFGEDSIVANLDTGVWPESASFDDAGYGPIPQRWKGSCQVDDATFKCNRKLIGARFFDKGYVAAVGKNNTKDLSGRDTEGHGSHTLSTIGGNFVANATVLGLGINTTAKGGSPRARVASYKVCWPSDFGGCFDSDILAGFEQAIHDGVDVLSVSLGGMAANYFEDVVAIGAFHAVKKGIVVVCSAGNSGPDPATVTNVAPWILTTGASSIDREFEADVVLGNGRRFKGTSVSNALKNNTLFPLTSGANAKLENASATDSTLDPSKVKGKILACLRGDNSRVDKGIQAYLVGAVGMILCNDELSGNELISDPHILPASNINYDDGVLVLAYINSTGKPMASLTPPVAALNVKPAPVMASFSSRGPNTVTPEILKPDVTAPGVNIIAAYSEAISPTEEETDPRRIPYITMSGTSMSCPHVSGLAGLLKTLYPHWSPAAIRSAIMTTARTRDNTMNPMTDSSNNAKSNPFAYGSGHIRPNRAMDPGLVYDLSNTDYLHFFCSLGYNETFLEPFLGEGQHYKCHPRASLRYFNYPSISVPYLSAGSSITLKRKVTNVGPPGTYSVSVRHPTGASITVHPPSLTFERAGQKKSFKVKVRGEYGSDGVAFGGMTWSDGKRYVRSPIAIRVTP